MADGGGIILPPLPNKPNYNSSPENALLPGVNQHLVESVVSQLPEIADVLRRVQNSRASFTELLLRTSISDVERLPPIHPSVASSRGEQATRYITFVTAPPIERRPPGKRPKHTPRKPLGEEECYRCQLHADHAECEKHKYLRIGGGFRHSYWYIRGILDVIEEEQRLAAEEAMRKYQEEQERLEEERRQREVPKRRVKTYVRTKSGRKIKQYHYFTEDEYKEFKKDDKTARKMLGLGENEELMDWTTTRGVYVQSDTGEFIKARKRKGEDGLPYLDYGQYDDDIAIAKGKHHRRRRYSDSDSIESGVGGSIVSGERRRHRRRHHRRRGSHSRDRSYSSDSYDSRDSRDGGNRRRRRHHRRRRHGSSDSRSDRSYDDDDRGHRRGGGRHRRRRRHRSYSSDDSGTDVGSGDGRDRRRRRHRRSRRRSYSDGGSSVDSYDSRDRRRRRRRRRRSYSDSDSDRSRSRRRGGRRHRRRHRDSSYSDYSDDSRDGDGGRRRGGGGRRRRRRRSYSDDSYSGDDDDRRRRRRSGRRHRRRRHRDSYSDDSYDSRDSRGYDDEGGGGRRRRRRRRRRSYDSYYSDSDDASGDEGGGGRRRGRRGKGGGGRRRRRHYSDSYSSYSDSDDDRGGGRGRRRRGRGRRRRYSDDSDDDYDGGSDGSRRHRRRRGKGGRRRRGGRRHGSSDDSYYSSDSDSDSSRRRRRRRRRRRDDSSYSDSSSSSYVSSVRSSDVSEASDPSSVHSSDISSISGDFSESEKRRLKAEKKRKIFEQKKQKKQEEKVAKVKEEVQVKREKKRQEKQEKKERKERKKEKRRERERRRRRHYSSSSSEGTRPVSPVRSDEVSSVHSSQVSSVSGDFSESEKRRRKEEKKKKLKEQKKEIKQREKEETRKEERRQRHERRRERRRRRSYMSTVSAASAVSSVHSSEISDISGDFSESEKARLKEEKKRKKKEEKQVTKQLKKEKERRDERRRERKGRRRGSDEFSSDDSYARGKQDFYDIPGEKRKSMVKYGKGSRRGLTSPIEQDDYRGMEWDKRKRKDKRGKRRQGDGADDDDDPDAQIEITTSDGKKVKMKKSVIRQLQREGKLDASGGLKQKIRLTKDGELARDSDSDAESVTLDTSTVTKMQSQAGVFDLHGINEKWTGFAPTPEPPKTPTDGGRIKLKGVRKVQAAFRKDQGRLQSHLQKVLESAKELKDDEPENTLDERDSSINFVAHYRLVDELKVDPFARAFVIEDGNEDLILDVSELKTAMEGIPSTQDVKEKQISYALKVLDIDDHSKISFKMFAVVAAVLERICNMDPHDQNLIDQSNLMDIERKMALYKAMFYCNVNSDRSPNFITAESLRIELIAGGLNRAQEEYIMSKMKPNEFREINFIDYMAYIPLFMSMHENIVGNPLDRSYKYTEKREEKQRDLVPLGLPMRKEFLDLPKNIFPSGGVSARVPDDSTQSGRAFIDSGELIGKQVNKLPKIGSRPSSRKKSRMFLSLD
ncbi:trichohyalin-like [Ptychodera flava]|uniref:trichohyalin-like n=1 Tax=Ptychodera flava TaxID=63121 RepID=UPI00396A6279